MTALAPADVLVPENFHEIARPRLGKVIKIRAEPEFVKETRCARTIRIPPAPHSLTVTLISNNELVESREIEFQLPAGAQLLDRSDEDEIRRARAKTRKRPFRKREQLARFEMRGGLQLDLGVVRRGILAAARHFPNLFENEAVKIFAICGNRESDAHRIPANNYESSEHGKKYAANRCTATEVCG